MSLRRFGKSCEARVCDYLARQQRSTAHPDWQREIYTRGVIEDEGISFIAALRSANNHSSEALVG